MNYGPVDIEAHAKRQLRRLSHWKDYPNTAEALRDYIAVVCKLGSPESITKFMDNLVLDTLDRCPTAAELNRMIFDVTAGRMKRKKECKICDSTGILTLYQLVTFHGKSYKIKAIENLNLDFEEVRPYIENLVAWQRQNTNADRQDVRSAAAVCECSKV